MKKLLSLFLVLIMVFLLASCGKTETSSNGDSIDIEYYAKLGKIPECEYAIGDSVTEIKEHYAQHQEQENADADHSHDLYEIIEGERTVLIDCGTSGYYYVKEKEANGISYIVSYDGAYGFKSGELITDVKNALSDYDIREETANSQNVFFMLGATGTVVKTEFEKYTLMFVFQDNALCATALYLTDDWQ